MYVVTCSCGWHGGRYPLRAVAIRWRRWHLFQVTPKGSRPNESGHVVTITKQ